MDISLKGNALIIIPGTMEECGLDTAARKALNLYLYFKKTSKMNYFARITSILHELYEKVTKVSFPAIFSLSPIPMAAKCIQAIHFLLSIFLFFFAPNEIP